MRAILAVFLFSLHFNFNFGFKLVNMASTTDSPTHEHLSSTVETIIGYAGLLLVIVMYGSYYVPVKPYKTYDGTVFQWYTASGMLLVASFIGVATDIILGKKHHRAGLEVPFEGLIGGAGQAIVLALFPFVVRLSGLAIGFVLWTATQIVVGWAISRFGLWGLKKEPASNEYFDYAGIFLCSISLCFILLVKPGKDVNYVRVHACLLCFCNILAQKK